MRHTLFHKNSPNSSTKLGEFSLSLPHAQISETLSYLFKNIRKL